MRNWDGVIKDEDVNFNMDITLTSFSAEYNDAEVSDSAERIGVITARSFTLIIQFLK